MVVCEVCNISYHGNHKQCPKCNDLNDVLKKEIKEKDETIEYLNRSLLEPKMDTHAMAEAMKATSEMAKAMQATMEGMQNMMKDLTLELKSSREKQPSKEDPPKKQDGGHSGCGACGGKPGGHFGSRFHGGFMEDLGDDEFDFREYLCTGEKKKSKFDIVKYLTESERKKSMPIDTSAKLIMCLQSLHDDMEELIPKQDCSGLRAHIKFMTIKASEDIYDIRALLSYDSAIREIATKKGIEAFTGSNTELSNRYLGYSGTKQAMSYAANSGSDSWSSGRNIGIRSNSGNRTGRGGGYNVKRQPLTGWKRVCAEKNCCFSFSRNARCDGCAFKHVCALCNASSHSMWSYPHNDNNKPAVGGVSGPN